MKNKKDSIVGFWRNLELGCFERRENGFGCFEERKTKTMLEGLK